MEPVQHAASPSSTRYRTSSTGYSSSSTRYGTNSTDYPRFFIWASVNRTSSTGYRLYIIRAWNRYSFRSHGLVDFPAAPEFVLLLVSCLSRDGLCLSLETDSVSPLVSWEMDFQIRFCHDAEVWCHFEGRHPNSAVPGCQFLRAEERQVQVIRVVFL